MNMLLLQEEEAEEEEAEDEEASFINEEMCVLWHDGIQVGYYFYL